MTPSAKYSIDVLAVFRDRLWLRGWVFDREPIRSLVLRAPGLIGGQCTISSWGMMASPDVEAAHGSLGRNSRFDQVVVIDQDRFDVASAAIVIDYEMREAEVISNLGLSSGQEANALTIRFRDILASKSSGELLEVGSRARSGVTRRNLIPQGWGYLGLDIVSGENVDLVGDAHELGTLFPTRRFDAVMAFSILEHLLMPWKFVVELNRVLHVGAVGLFCTHQSWPVHDEPWDFWRFSDQAWHGLLNPDTGFEIIDARMSEPAFIVAQRCHAVTAFGVGQTGYLASNVLFRKMSETSLTWPVAIGRVLSTSYPGGGAGFAHHD